MVSERTDQHHKVEPEQEGRALNAGSEPRSGLCILTSAGQEACPGAPRHEGPTEMMGRAWGGGGTYRAVVLDTVIPEAAGRELLPQHHGQPIDDALPHTHDVP